MLLNKFNTGTVSIYTLFDANEKVVIHPTHYLNRLRRNNRPSESQRQIAYVIKLHCQWIENSPFFKGLEVDEALSLITNDDILDWINAQRSAGLSETTIHNRELLVYEMYKWLTTSECGIRKDLPWTSRPYTKQPHDKLPRYLTTQQIIKLLSGMHNESQRLAAHFMFDTGVRVSELSRFKRKHLPNEDDYPEWFNYYPLTVLGSKPFDGGKYKIRDTIISRPMLARIRRYHSTTTYKAARKWSMNDPEKPVFLNVHGNELSKSSVYKSIKKAWERGGRETREVSPHQLRHGTAYSVLRSELGNELLNNLIILRSMLGHEDIKTTEIYSSIPIIVLQSLCRHQPVHLRYEEAEEIYRATYLPEFQNVQKRGRLRIK